MKRPPPPPLLVALQFVNEHSVMFRSPELSTSRLTAPPFKPALHDVKATPVIVRDAEEERVKSSAPPLSSHMQDVKVRLERVIDRVVSAEITAPPPLFFVMEVNVVFEIECTVDEEEVSMEEEMEKRDWDWSVIEVNTLPKHSRIPEPVENKEEEWMSEGEEVTIILLRVSVPIDVIVKRGDVRGTVSVIVNESRMSD